MRRGIALIVSLAVPAADLAGQTVAARAVAAVPRSSVRLGSATERMGGVWAGVALDLQAGRFTLSGTGLRGQLTPPGETALLAREAGEMSVNGAYQIRPWLGLELGYAARAFSSAAGRQRWNLWGARATVSRSLGLPGVRAYASGVAFPVVDVSDEANLITGWGSEVGIRMTRARMPVLKFSYQIERFIFPALSGRSEQFEALTFSVGVRIGRIGGRWKVGG